MSTAIQDAPDAVQAGAPAALPAVQVPDVSSDSRPAMDPQESDLHNLRILFVDDEPYNILVVRKYLQDVGYRNFIATTEATEVIGMIREEQPDLVLLDIVMPDINGLELLKLLGDEGLLQRLPVLILTASTDPETKNAALKLGADDFLAKPIDPHDLIPRVTNALMSKARQDRLADYAGMLEEQVRERTFELEESHKAVVHCLARAAEFRDDDTGHHVKRVGLFAGVLARELGFDDAYVETIELAAQLHDVGKIGVPDDILNKPGKLDPEQYDRIKTHCGMGKRIIQPLGSDEWQMLRKHTSLGMQLLNVRSSSLIAMAAIIAQTHHEWWNGAGYPLGLAGNDIPIEGRITSVADVYDALSSRRAYKEPFPREKCFAILEEGRETQFDPRVLDALIARQDEIVNIQLQFMDGA